MKNSVNEFAFKGLDKQTNLYINLCIGFLFGIILASLSVFFWFKLQLISPRFSIVLAAFIGISIVLVSLKPLGRKYGKEWRLALNNRDFYIYYNELIVSNTVIDSFTSIALRGDARNQKSNSRYLTLNTKEKKIKIIVTNSMYMPFSTISDIICFDNFMQVLDEVLRHSFIKEDCTKIMTPKGILYYKYTKNKKI